MVRTGWIIAESGEGSYKMTDPSGPPKPREPRPLGPAMSDVLTRAKKTQIHPMPLMSSLFSHATFSLLQVPGLPKMQQTSELPLETTDYFWFCGLSLCVGCSSAHALDL